jgi:hypothetical protein
MAGTCTPTSSAVGRRLCAMCPARCWRPWETQVRVGAPTARWPQQSAGHCAQAEDGAPSRSSLVLGSPSPAASPSAARRPPVRVRPPSPRPAGELERAGAMSGCRFTPSLPPRQLHWQPAVQACVGGEVKVWALKRSTVDRPAVFTHRHTLGDQNPLGGRSPVRFGALVLPLKYTSQ